MTFPEQYFFYANLLVLIFYIIFAVVGYSRGFLSGIISLLGSFVSFFVAWRYCSVAVKFFHPLPSSMLPMQDTLMAEQIEVFSNQMAWFVILYLVMILVFFILEKIARGVQKAPGIHEISAILGGILGVVKATVWVLAICVALNNPFFTNGRALKDQTVLGSIAQAASQAVEVLGLPVSSSDAINSIYTGSQNLNDKDRKAVENWLEEHGFDQIEQRTGD